MEQEGSGGGTGTKNCLSYFLRSGGRTKTKEFGSAASSDHSCDILKREKKVKKKKNAHGFYRPSEVSGNFEFRPRAENGNAIPPIVPQKKKKKKKKKKIKFTLSVSVDGRVLFFGPNDGVLRLLKNRACVVPVHTEQQVLSSEASGKC